MQTQNKTIKTKAAVFSDIKEQSVEADLILPDYYPDISKILKCSVNPSTEAVTVSGDRISVAGAALIKLVFCGDDKSINVYEAQVKYTKVLQCSDIEATDIVDVMQTAGSLNYKALGPKRVEVRAVAVVKVNVHRLCEKTVLTDVNEKCIQKHICEKKCFGLSSFLCGELNINENVKSASQGTFKSVLQSNAAVSVEEIKPAKNKLMVRGKCAVATTYITESGDVAVLSYPVPFTEICDAYAVSDDTKCFVGIKSADVFVSVKDNSEGSVSLDVNIKLPFVLLAGTDDEIMYIDDVYSVAQDIDACFCKLDVLKAVTPCEGRLHRVFTADSYDENITEVCDAFVDDIRYSIEASSGNVKATGSLNVNAVLKNTDGQFVVITRTFAFEEALAIDAVSFGEGFISLMCDSVSASVNGGKVNFTVDMKYSGFVCSNDEQKMLYSIDFKEADSTQPNENVVIYYAHSGEKLWDIAKENRSTVDKISAVNNISSDVIRQDCVLVFPNF